MNREAVGYGRPRDSGWQRALMLLTVLFIAGGMFCGYLVYTTVRDLVGRSQMAILPSLPSRSGVVHAQTENVVTLPARKERINILLLGIDQREIETGPCRTDTMIVISIDPQNKSVSMLSIPRDLWVSIPDYNEHNRINAAHLFGDARDYPGGGPALAKKTVQYFLGIPIHNYVRINFAGFEKIVDTIGGITINVEQAIHDDKYPDEHYGYMTVDIPAGVQKMNGATALQYARVRHGSSDFYRARRQQQVLTAIKDKAMSLDIPLTSIPQLVVALGNAMSTDLSLADLEYLARLAREVRPENIRSGIIDESMTTGTKTPEGWDVLIPNRERIRELVDELFAEPTANGHPADAPVDLLIQEAAKLEVLNGTGDVGLAERTAAYLSKQGYLIGSYANADRSDYAQTIIIDYAGKPQTVKSLAELLKVPTENIRSESHSMGVNVRVILGRDYSVGQ